jgi:hypothetical protein
MISYDNSPFVGHNPAIIGTTTIVHYISFAPVHFRDAIC